jgi:cysteine desulfurase / selenocysteine lyase
MEKLRQEFPIFTSNSSLVYFDSAATCQKPKRVIDKMTQFLQEDYGTVHRAVYSLAAQATFQYDAVRQLVREFLGVGELGEVIFTRGTTDGINLVAASFGKAYVDEGDEILVLETEHHSNIVPWQLLCKEKKAFLRVIPVNDLGEVLLDEYAKMLNSKTKLVAVAHIANSTGVIHPIKEMISLAHEKGAKVLVDAAQSASHKAIDVEELDVDFLVFSGHKVYGPTGIGVLYGKRVLLDQMPPYQGGGDMVHQVSFEKTTYQPLPLKFEAGTPNIVEVMGLGAAIEFMQEIGFDRIEKFEHSLTEYAYSKMKNIEGLIFLAHSKEIFSMNRSSILSFHFKECHCLDVGTLLDLKGFAVRTGHLCSQPALKRFGVSSVIRVSFAVYNTFEEVDLFIKALEEVVLMLRDKG